MDFVWCWCRAMRRDPHRDGARPYSTSTPAYKAPTDGKRARPVYGRDPGPTTLRNKLEAQVASHGWLPGLDGRRVPTRAQYTALNYALASIEAIVCKRWLVNVYDELLHPVQIWLGW